MISEILKEEEFWEMDSLSRAFVMKTRANVRENFDALEMCNSFRFCSYNFFLLFPRIPSTAETENQSTGKGQIFMRRRVKRTAGELKMVVNMRL